ncbi:MAG: hypothetical protein ABIP48_04320 [Planctomycetota bacterium]
MIVGNRRPNSHANGSTNSRSQQGLSQAATTESRASGSTTGHRAWSAEKLGGRTVHWRQIRIFLEKDLLHVLQRNQRSIEHCGNVLRLTRVAHGAEARVSAGKQHHFPRRQDQDVERCESVGPDGDDGISAGFQSVQFKCAVFVDLRSAS